MPACDRASRSRGSGWRICFGSATSFSAAQKNFGKIVVHGHTPRELPQVLPNRINLDTGAYATGRLTCLVADGEGQRFLATR